MTLVRRNDPFGSIFILGAGFSYHAGLPLVRGLLPCILAEFVALYNDQWLIEKNGYLSPRQARVAHYVREVEAAA